MSLIIRIILIVFSVAVTAVAAHFVFGYSAVERHDAMHLKIELTVLATAIARFSPWFYTVPLILGALGAATVRRRWHDECVVAITAFAILFAIAWPLLCLFAFRVSHQILGNQVI